MSDRSVAPAPQGPALVENICIRRDHYFIGRGRPDGSGHLTLVDSRWAYCAAARATEEHYWLRFAGRPLREIPHAIDWLASGPSASAEPEGDGP